MKVWKNYTIEYTMVVIGKSYESHPNPMQQTSTWRKLCPDPEGVPDSTGFTVASIKKILKLWIRQKKEKQSGGVE